MEELELNSDNARHIVQSTIGTYLDGQYRHQWNVIRVMSICNQELQEAFLWKRRQMSLHGRTEEQLERRLAFGFFTDLSPIKRIAETGLHVHNMHGFSRLGDSKKGIILLQNADVALKSAAYQNYQDIFLMIFEVMLGQQRVITGFCDIELSHLFDSHVSNVQPTSQDNIVRQACHSQVYLYELSVDGRLSSRPSHVLPVAVIQCKSKASYNNNNTSLANQWPQMSSMPAVYDFPSSQHSTSNNNSQVTTQQSSTVSSMNVCIQGQTQMQRFQVAAGSQPYHDLTACNMRLPMTASEQASYQNLPGVNQSLAMPRLPSTAMCNMPKTRNSRLQVRQQLWQRRRQQQIQQCALPNSLHQQNSHFGYQDNYSHPQQQQQQQQQQHPLACSQGQYYPHQQQQQRQISQSQFCVAPLEAATATSNQVELSASFQSFNITPGWRATQHQQQQSEGLKLPIEVRPTGEMPSFSNVDDIFADVAESHFMLQQEQTVSSQPAKLVVIAPDEGEASTNGRDVLAVSGVSLSGACSSDTESAVIDTNEINDTSHSMSLAVARSGDTATASGDASAIGDATAIDNTYSSTSLPVAVNNDTESAVSDAIAKDSADGNVPLPATMSRDTANAISDTIATDNNNSMSSASSDTERRVVEAVAIDNANSSTLLPENLNTLYGKDKFPNSNIDMDTVLHNAEPSTNDNVANATVSSADSLVVNTSVNSPLVSASITEPLSDSGAPLDQSQTVHNKAQSLVNGVHSAETSDEPIVINAMLTNEARNTHSKQPLNHDNYSGKDVEPQAEKDVEHNAETQLPLKVDQQGDLGSLSASLYCNNVSTCRPLIEHAAPEDKYPIIGDRYMIRTLEDGSFELEIDDSDDETLVSDTEEFSNAEQVSSNSFVDGPSADDFSDFSYDQPAIYHSSNECDECIDAIVTTDCTFDVNQILQQQQDDTKSEASETSQLLNINDIQNAITIEKLPEKILDDNLSQNSTLPVDVLNKEDDASIAVLEHISRSITNDEVCVPNTQVEVQHANEGVSMSENGSDSALAVHATNTISDNENCQNENESICVSGNRLPSKFKDGVDGTSDELHEDISDRESHDTCNKKVTSENTGKDSSGDELPSLQIDTGHDTSSTVNENIPDYANTSDDKCALESSVNSLQINLESEQSHNCAAQQCTLSNTNNPTSIIDEHVNVKNVTPIVAGGTIESAIQPADAVVINLLQKGAEGMSHSDTGSHIKWWSGAKFEACQKLSQATARYPKSTTRDNTTKSKMSPLKKLVAKNSITATSVTDSKFNVALPANSNCDHHLEINVVNDNRSTIACTDLEKQPSCESESGSIVMTVDDITPSVQQACGSSSKEVVNLHHVQQARDVIIPIIAEVVDNVIVESSDKDAKKPTNMNFGAKIMTTDDGGSRHITESEAISVAADSGVNMEKNCQGIFADGQFCTNASAQEENHSHSVDLSTDKDGNLFDVSSAGNGLLVDKKLLSAAVSMKIADRDQSASGKNVVHCTSKSDQQISREEEDLTSHSLFQPADYLRTDLLNADMPAKTEENNPQDRGNVSTADCIATSVVQDNSVSKALLEGQTLSESQSTKSNNNGKPNKNNSEICLSMTIDHTTQSSVDSRQYTLETVSGNDNKASTSKPKDTIRSSKDVKRSTFVRTGYKYCCRGSDLRRQGYYKNQYRSDKARYYNKYVRRSIAHEELTDDKCHDDHHKNLCQNGFDGTNHDKSSKPLAAHNHSYRAVSCHKENLQYVCLPKKLPVVRDIDSVSHDKPVNHQEQFEQLANSHEQAFHLVSSNCLSDHQGQEVSGRPTERKSIPQGKTAIRKRRRRRKRSRWDNDFQESTTTHIRSRWNHTTIHGHVDLQGQASTQRPWSWQNNPSGQAVDNGFSSSQHDQATFKYSTRATETIPSQSLQYSDPQFHPNVTGQPVKDQRQVNNCVSNDESNYSPQHFQPSAAEHPSDEEEFAFKFKRCRLEPTHFKPDAYVTYNLKQMHSGCSKTVDPRLTDYWNWPERCRKKTVQEPMSAHPIQTESTDSGKMSSDMVQQTAGQCIDVIHTTLSSSSSSTTTTTTTTTSDQLQLAMTQVLQKLENAVKQLNKRHTAVNHVTASAVGLQVGMKRNKYSAGNTQKQDLNKENDKCKGSVSNCLEKAVEQSPSESKDCSSFESLVISAKDIGEASKNVLQLIEPWHFSPPQTSNRTCVHYEDHLSATQQFLRQTGIFNDKTSGLSSETCKRALAGSGCPLSLAVLHQLRLEQELSSLSNVKDLPKEACDYQHKIATELLQWQLCDIGCFEKSDMLEVLPESLRLAAERHRFISVEGCLLFMQKRNLALGSCRYLFALKTEIEKAQASDGDLEGDVDLQGKLGWLHLQRRRFLAEVCTVSVKQLQQNLQKRLTWYREVATELKKDPNRYSNEYIDYVNKRIFTMQHYLNVSTYLQRGATGIWEFKKKAQTQFTGVAEVKKSAACLPVNDTDSKIAKPVVASHSVAVACCTDVASRPVDFTNRPFDDKQKPVALIKPRCNLPKCVSPSDIQRKGDDAIINGNSPQHISTVGMSRQNDKDSQIGIDERNIKSLNTSDESQYISISSEEEITISSDEEQDDCVNANCPPVNIDGNHKHRFKIPKKMPQKTSQKTPKETSQKTTKEISQKTPKKTSQKTPKKKTSLKTPKEMSQKTPKETSQKTPKETSQKTPKETPKETSQKTPLKISQETRKETLQMTPKETLKETPQKTLKETPKETSQKTPQKISQETLKEASQKTPQKTLQKTPKEASQKIPQNISQETPKEASQKTPKEASQKTPKETQKHTLQKMQQGISKKTLKKTANETQKELPQKTLQDIPNKKILQTPQKAPEKIVQKTAKPIPKSTPKVSQNRSENTPAYTSKEMTETLPKGTTQRSSQEASWNIAQKIPERTPQKTAKVTLKQALQKVPRKMAESVPGEGSKETLPKTPIHRSSQETSHKTLLNTTQKTPEMIPHKTSKVTPKETLHEVPQKTQEVASKKRSKETSQNSSHEKTAPSEKPTNMSTETIQRTLQKLTQKMQQNIPQTIKKKTPVEAMQKADDEATCTMSENYQEASNTSKKTVCESTTSSYVQLISVADSQRTTSKKTVDELNSVSNVTESIKPTCKFSDGQQRNDKTPAKTASAIKTTSSGSKKIKLSPTVYVSSQEKVAKTFMKTVVKPHTERINLTSVASDRKKQGIIKTSTNTVSEADTLPTTSKSTVAGSGQQKTSNTPLKTTSKPNMSTVRKTAKLIPIVSDIFQQRTNKTANSTNAKLSTASYDKKHNMVKMPLKTTNKSMSLKRVGELITIDNRQRKTMKTVKTAMITPEVSNSSCQRQLKSVSEPTAEISIEKAAKLKSATSNISQKKTVKMTGKTVGDSTNSINSVARSDSEKRKVVTTLKKNVVNASVATRVNETLKQIFASPDNRKQRDVHTSLVALNCNKPNATSSDNIQRQEMESSLTNVGRPTGKHGKETPASVASDSSQEKIVKSSKKAPLNKRPVKRPLISKTTVDKSPSAHGISDTVKLTSTVSSNSKGNIIKSPLTSISGSTSKLVKPLSASTSNNTHKIATSAANEMSMVIRPVKSLTSFTQQGAYNKAAQKKWKFDRKRTFSQIDNGSSQPQSGRMFSRKRQRNSFFDLVGKAGSFSYQNWRQRDVPDNQQQANSFVPNEQHWAFGNNNMVRSGSSGGNCQMKNWNTSFHCNPEAAQPVCDQMGRSIQENALWEEGRNREMAFFNQDRYHEVEGVHYSTNGTVAWQKHAFKQQEYCSHMQQLQDESGLPFKKTRWSRWQ